MWNVISPDDNLVISCVHYCFVMFDWTVNEKLRLVGSVYQVLFE